MYSIRNFTQQLELATPDEVISKPGITVIATSKLRHEILLLETRKNFLDAIVNDKKMQTKRISRNIFGIQTH